MNKLLIKHINIFNPENSSIIYDQTIFIEDDIIQSVSSTTVDMDNVESIDGSNKFAIAGMFECHAHLAELTSKDVSFQKSLLKKTTTNNYLWDEFTSSTLQGFINKGITQIRDVGGPVDNLSDLNNKIRNNQLIGPDIFYSGPMLESSPLRWESCNSYLPDFTVAINTEEDLKILDTLKLKGASFIKTFGMFDKNIHKTLIRKAKSLNLPVTHDPGAPLFNAIPMNLAINTGITCIEHGKAPLACTLIPELQSRHDALGAERAKVRKEPGAVNPKEIQNETKRIVNEVWKLREKAICQTKLKSLLSKTLSDNFYCCPTLHVLEDLSKKIRPSQLKNKNSNLKKDEINAIDSIIFFQNYFVRGMIKTGTKILVGHDGFFPENTFKEMKLLYEAGLSISEILKGATIYPARWLQIDDLYGSVAQSKKANICILNLNPLLSIENINTVYMVIKNGKIVFKK